MCLNRKTIELTGDLPMFAYTGGNSSTCLRFLMVKSIFGDESQAKCRIERLGL